MNLGNLLIIGDSYSTFEGYIPEGYVFWYGYDDKGRTDVVAKEETWWSQLATRVECSLIRNESYSGTTVSNTERPTMPGTSFVYRTERLVESGFFRENKIDTVMIFGTTNDSWIDSPIGEIKYDNISREDIKSVLPAYAYLVSLVKENAPEARIIAIANCDIKDEIINGILEIAEHYGAKGVRLANVSKQNGHPDKQGMKEICEQVVAAL